MNILIATDTNYAKYYKVMLTSLCENNYNVKINVYLFYSQGLSREGIEDLKELERIYSIEFKPYYMDFFKNVEVKHWSVETYFRLLALELPDSVERILWLDGDVIVRRSIVSFYNSEFDKAYFIACEDRAISQNKDKDEYRRIGFRPEQIYVNGGVLLMNLKELRKDFTGRQFVDYIEENWKTFCYVDQSFINKMFGGGQIKVMDELKYNCQVNCHHYKEEAIILEQASIIHFAGNNQRPWDYSFRKHYGSAVNGEVWWYYARKCGWKKEYYKWRVRNWIQVRPWQIIYNVYKYMGNKVKGSLKK